MVQADLVAVEFDVDRIEVAVCRVEFFGGQVRVLRPSALALQVDLCSRVGDVARQAFHRNGLLVVERCFDFAGVDRDDLRVDRDVIDEVVTGLVVHVERQFRDLFAVEVFDIRDLPGDRVVGPRIVQVDHTGVLAVFRCDDHGVQLLAVDLGGLVVIELYIAPVGAVGHADVELVEGRDLALVFREGGLTVLDGQFHVLGRVCAEHIVGVARCFHESLRAFDDIRAGRALAEGGDRDFGVVGNDVTLQGLEVCERVDFDGPGDTQHGGAVLAADRCVRAIFRLFGGRLVMVAASGFADITNLVGRGTHGVRVEVRGSGRAVERVIRDVHEDVAAVEDLCAEGDRRIVVRGDRDRIRLALFGRCGQRQFVVFDRILIRLGVAVCRIDVGRSEGGSLPRVAASFSDRDDGFRVFQVCRKTGEFHGLAVGQFSRRAIAVNRKKVDVKRVIEDIEVLVICIGQVEADIDEFFAVETADFVGIPGKVGALPDIIEVDKAALRAIFCGQNDCVDFLPGHAFEGAEVQFYIAPVGTVVRFDIQLVLLPGLSLEFGERGRFGIAAQFEIISRLIREDIVGIRRCFHQRIGTGAYRGGDIAMARCRDRDFGLSGDFRTAQCFDSIEALRLDGPGDAFHMGAVLAANGFDGAVFFDICGLATVVSAAGKAGVADLIGRRAHGIGIHIGSALCAVESHIRNVHHDIHAVGFSVILFRLFFAGDRSFRDDVEDRLLGSFGRQGCGGYGIPGFDGVFRGILILEHGIDALFLGHRLVVVAVIDRIVRVARLAGNRLNLSVFYGKRDRQIVIRPFPIIVISTVVDDFGHFRIGTVFDHFIAGGSHDRDGHGEAGAHGKRDRLFQYRVFHKFPLFLRKRALHAALPTLLGSLFKMFALHYNKLS